MSPNISSQNEYHPVLKPYSWWNSHGNNENKERPSEQIESIHNEAERRYTNLARIMGITNTSRLPDFLHASYSMDLIVEADIFHTLSSENALWVKALQQEWWRINNYIRAHILSLLYDETPQEGEKEREMYESIFAQIIHLMGEKQKLLERLKQITGQKFDLVESFIDLSLITLGEHWWGKMRLTAQKIEERSLIRAIEDAEDRYFERQWKSIEWALNAKGMKPETVAEKKKSFRAWLRDSPVGRDIVSQSLRAGATATSLLIMGFCIHDRPDQKRAILEYGSFILMSRGQNWIMSLITKIPKLEKILPKLTRLSGKWGWIGTAVVLVAFVAAFSNEWVSDAFIWFIEWVEDNIPTTSFTHALFEFLALTDIPVQWVSDILHNTGILTTEPMREQMDYLKRYSRNIRWYGGSLWLRKMNLETYLSEWNMRVDSSTETSEIARQYSTPDRINPDDRAAWWRSRIPDFFWKYTLLVYQEQELEAMLRSVWFLEPDEHLSYTRLATTLSTPSRSNRHTIDLAEDDEHDEVMYWTKRLLTYTGIGDRLSHPITKLTRPERYKVPLREAHKDEKVQQTLNEASELYRQLREWAKSLSDEVDVYSDMWVYTPDIWKNPLGKVAGNEGFIERYLSYEQRMNALMVRAKDIGWMKKELWDIMKLVPIHSTGFLERSAEKVQSRATRMTDVSVRIQICDHIGQLLSTCINKGIDWQVLNTFIKSHISPLIIQNTPASRESLDKVMVGAMKLYESLWGKNTWSEAHPSIRAFHPEPWEGYIMGVSPRELSWGALKEWYLTEVKKLTDPHVTNWTQLWVKVLDTSHIEVFRADFQEDTFMMEKQENNTWKLRSREHGELPWTHTFQAWVALANLSLYYRKALFRRWKQQEKKPFFIYRESLWYSIDMQEVMTGAKEKNWVKFYTENLHIPPETLVLTLNSYFEKL